jgi:thermitase
MDRHASEQVRGWYERRSAAFASILALAMAILLAAGIPGSVSASARQGAGAPDGGAAGISIPAGPQLSPEGMLRSPLPGIPRSAPYRQGVVLVGFRPGVSTKRLHAIERAAGVQDARRLGPSIVTARGPGAHRAAGQLISPFEVRVPDLNVLSAVRRLRRHGAVAYAEPDYLMRESAVPNDPSFALQWGSSNTGQAIPTQESEELLGPPVGGTPGAEDGALSAWRVATGGRSIVIGETDSGVDYTHPDLAANIWSNPGGIGGCAAGTHGYNVLSSSCNPMDEDTTYGGHGTHVAGIMGAVGNNGIGIAGMNWQTAILPVKWLNTAGWGETGALIEAMQWLVAAKQEGVNVRVVNDSDTFWGTAYSQALRDEIETLGANNILLVTAAGNTGNNNDEVAVQRYPCSYDLPNEICVTASDNNDLLPGWANYGPHTVDLAAPGVSIYSTLREGRYGYLSGGSMASPQVAGAAALILSVEPSLSATALKADILQNVDKLPSLAGRVISEGRLDVCRALPGCGQPPPPPPSVPVNTGLPAIAGTPQAGQTLTASSGSWTESPTGYEYQWQRCAASGAGCTAIPGAGSRTYVAGSGDIGSTLRVSVMASNSGGSSAPAISAQTAAVQTAALTFGKTSVGPSPDSFAANRKRVSLYPLPSAGNVSKLSIYLEPGGGSGHQALEGIVYADSGGKPGALLGTTNQLTFLSTNAPGWYDLTFSAPLKLAAGSYWIGVITGATSYVAGFRYQSLSGGRDYNANTYTSKPSNPFGAVATDREQTSLYATYTP